VISPLVLLVASACGGLGAACRYLVDVAVARATRSPLPWGVLLVNVTGSLLLGLVTSLLPEAAFVLGAGFLGGYTTFSTAMIDALALWRDGAKAAAVLDVVAMLVLSLAAALAGLALGGMLR